MRVLDASSEHLEAAADADQLAAVTQVPRNRGAASLTYAHPKYFTAFFSVQVVGRQFDDDQNVRFVPLQAPYVWWDTIWIPAAITKNGVVIPGHVKIRHRFVDFTGMYVFHCHILAHEYRGMMQLVEVVSNKPTVEHYH